MHSDGGSVTGGWEESRSTLAGRHVQRQGAEGVYNGAHYINTALTFTHPFFSLPHGAVLVLLRLNLNS